MLHLDQRGSLLASHSTYIVSSMPNADLFWTNVDKTDTCWLWNGSMWRTGYGRFWDRDTNMRRAAHLLSYEMLVGPVPEGLQLDHLCRVRHCVNPDHLEPVTAGENQRRGYLAGRSKPGSPPGTLQGGALVHLAKTHCPNGHPYSGDNLYVTPKGHRVCKACKNTPERKAAMREYQRQYKLRKKAQV